MIVQESTWQKTGQGMRSQYDIAIVGAGIIGCALARRFTLDGARVLVLEKSLDVLDGASKGNSAILHTSFDAPPGSREQACITAGYKEYLEIAQDLSLPILESGALVIAWSDEQLKQLPNLVKRAHQNGITDVKMLDREEILRREPNLSRELKGGFEVPGEFLIDPWTAGHAYLLQALANGAILKRNAEVIDGNFDGDLWLLRTACDDFRVKTVINCAGLYGDQLDELLIGKRRFTILPKKGQFVVFDKTAADLVSSIILPVPTPTSKGILLCRTIFGNVLVGPTAEDQESRTDTSTARSALRDLRNKGINMLPSLKTCEVVSTFAGLRPATEFKDYQIHHHKEQSYVTIGGIRSTGLSSALGIAQYVTKLLHDTGYQYEPLPDPRIPPADRLSNYHERDWQSSGSKDILCHCELVTRQEIEGVMRGLMPPNTLQGLKRRTRATMGVCQGFYCAGELGELFCAHLKNTVGDKCG